MALQGRHANRLRLETGLTQVNSDLETHAEHPDLSPQLEQLEADVAEISESLATHTHDHPASVCYDYKFTPNGGAGTSRFAASDVNDAIDFQLAIGPAGEVFREAGAEAEEKRALIEAALAEAINQQNTAAEGIVMDSSSWVISANNPEH